MSGSLSRLVASVTDGRAQNIRFRQNQLRLLHQALISDNTAIKDAIVEDAGFSKVEAEIEYVLGISCVKEHYLSLNLKGELDDEYAITRGKDGTDRRVPTGIMSIIPSDHCLFYSILAPLSAAIAAGNCVAVQIDQDEGVLRGLLHKILNRSLDSDTFCTVNGSSTEKGWLQSLQVIQSGPIAPSPSRLACDDGTVVAIVDRSADLEAAAAALVTARFAFKGRSPYAPDLVLVNEFVKTPFVNAVLRHTFRYQAEGTNGDQKRPHPTNPGAAQDQRLMKEIEGTDGANIITSGPNGTVVNLIDRSSLMISRKVQERILFVHTIRSLDDAIDLANSGSGPLLMTYVFASPGASKYLGQFVGSRATCVNQVPSELLVGPAAPQTHPLNYRLRYTTNMFSVPSPHFVTTKESSKDLATVLAGSDVSNISTALNKLSETATAPLPPTGQPPGGNIGFFEQGLFTGAGSALTVLIMGLSGLLFYGR